MIVQDSTTIYTATIMREEHQCSRGQGERCRGSKSPICVCACGGWNHGNQAARRKAVQNDTEEARLKEEEMDNWGGSVG